ncbi:ABC transporter ATP-binding protein [Streptomyces canus]|uniref:ABC transporter ATP-binding protein n=1 Tax=Streptomyces canus TaxID=58343 RepID=UPI00036DA056|nr:ABC transporter ATP-binding protein [Streptomyces canus]
MNTEQTSLNTDGVDRSDTAESGFIDVAETSKVYRRNGEVKQALRSASFQVGRGQFVSLVGPSGCGKTTLLRMIAGLVTPTTGQIQLNGTRVDGPRRDTGMVFQSPTLLPWRTVLGNIMLPVDILRRNRREYRDRAHELLDMVGLGECAHQHPWELSGGMQQRVGICRALIHNPSVLLMDEPFAALDAISRESLNRELLHIWRASQKTIVFVTHSISEAMYLSDQVVVMQSHPGRVRQILQIHTPREHRANDPQVQKAAQDVRVLLERNDPPAPDPATSGASR